MTNQYSVITGLEKSVFRVIVAVGPLLIGVMPQDWLNITLGGVIMFLINYAKNRNIQEVEDAISQS